jgi:hypothetical protein
MNHPLQLVLIAEVIFNHSAPSKSRHVETVLNVIVVNAGLAADRDNLKSFSLISQGLSAHFCGVTGRKLQSRRSLGDILVTPASISFRSSSEVIGVHVVLMQANNG